ncbi:MAG: M48 family metalloprotease, partial [Rariglobus sp.]
MDFFEAQARAKKRTTRLVALFVLAVLGIIVVGYFATMALLGYVSRPETSGNVEAEYQFADTAGNWWNPQLFLGVMVVTVVVVGCASLFKWMQLRAGGRAVAEMVGAREVSLQTTVFRERQLLNVVEEMSIAAGLPLPAIYVLDDETAINAFAAGLTTSDAVVAVTRGTLEKLNRDELQAVVAHEFSHILNGDMRLNTRLTAVLFGILAIGLVGRSILYSLRFSRPRRGKEGNGVFVMIALGLILLVLG